ncbi:hypothetical protein EV421DRAFT_1075763 [Armillaria borealis]|uniref:DNA helicase n=1 Tax=Armillaria borealis TaxID=47425 RepID=A0AA39MJH7_9AGAR|nr:hypothetical protein EV421DRAFT_1075763 [Armillaria borealis]
MPDHILTLKVSALCRLTHNFDPLRGLTKNTHVIIHHMYNHSVEVETIPIVVAGEAIASEIITLPHIDCHFQPQNLNFIVHRKQIPLALAYAVTFNGCQGLTVSCLVLDLRRPVFSHGQLYAAATWVPNSRDVLILKAEGDVSTLTTNVV